MRKKFFAFLSLTFLLAACASHPTTQAPTASRPPVEIPIPPNPPAPETALTVGVRPGPSFTALKGWANTDLTLSLAAFIKSCRAVTRREDASGLTRPEDWKEACTAALSAADARRFFEHYFEPVTVGEGVGLNTGYFEPEILGARQPSTQARTPIYRRPPDLVDVDLSRFSENLKGRTVRGRIEGNQLIPYFDRAQIEDGALAGQGLELAYAVDPYELFFLHIQGSGRLRLPDGSVMRIGYDGQNGRDYVGIGKRLREQNLLGPGQATMDGIIAWLRAHPAEGRALMRENKSYIFFRELTGEGPLGALGIALTPEVSVAADPKFVPLGAPLWLDTVTVAEDSRSYHRLMVAQDTGGAIKGANRFDLFWGAGPRARLIAGSLSATGRATLLLPRTAVARLVASIDHAASTVP